MRMDHYEGRGSAVQPAPPSSPTKLNAGFRIVNKTNVQIYVRGRDKVVDDHGYQIIYSSYEYFKVPRDVHMLLNSEDLIRSGLKSIVNRFTGFDIEAWYIPSEEEFKKLCIYFNVDQQRWLVHHEDSSGRNIGVNIYPCSDRSPTTIEFI
jgi:hypothetical protein